MPWEIDFLNWLQTIHNPILDKLMVGITYLGSGGILWIIIALCLLLNKKYRTWGIVAAASLIGCLIIGNLILKPLVARTRPYDVVGFANLLVGRLSDYSFPSGHTYASFAAATVLFAMNKKWGTCALIVAAFISFSRLYLYVHFPTDVLAGFVIGVVIALFCIQFIKPRIPQKWRGELN